MVSSLFTTEIRSTLYGRGSQELDGVMEQLFEEEKALETLHKKAKVDSDIGFQVVAQYQVFLNQRQILIKLLREENIPVPWQLHLTVKELDLMLVR